MKKWLILLIFLAAGAANLHAVDKDIIRIGDDVVIEAGDVVDNVIVIGGDITVYGTVEENIVAIGGEVRMKENAFVGNDVITIGDQLIGENLGHIDGEIIDISFGRLLDLLPQKERASPFFAIFSVMSFIAITLLGVAIAAIFPAFIRNLTHIFEEFPGRVIGWGLLTLFLMIPLTIILMLSIIGIALIPFEIVFLILTTILGYVVVSNFIGGKIIHTLSKQDAGSVVWNTLLGFFLLYLITLVPLLGTVVIWLVRAIGMGVVLVRIKRLVVAEKAA